MPIAPPLKIIHHFGSFEVRDSAGRYVAHVYFADGTTRRTTMDRLTKAEAREIAQKIAWALSAP